MTTGIRKLKNGYWGYRITWEENGKQKNKRGSKDKFGNPYYTKAQAIEARKEAIKELEERYKRTCVIVRKTYEEVFTEYQQTGRADKAKSTIRKQDSLWENHISKKFAKRILDEVSVAEINEYLVHLYYGEDRAYSYVEGFLKMFYLILGQGYSRNYIDVDAYNKLCVNKNTKIRMPKRKVDDDDEIVVFTPEEVGKMDDYFRGSNAETAYMLGKYCGLRINECYGITWDDVDFEKRSIKINKQMLYDDGIFFVGPVKTRNGKRTVYMSKRLLEYLKMYKEKVEKSKAEYAKSRKQKETIIPHADGTEYSSLDFINTLPNGKRQTINSMKYHAKQLKSEGIYFKYHYLRHTYGTRLADMNTPAHVLCLQMGHANINITLKYYVGSTDAAIDGLIKNLDRM